MNGNKWLVLFRLLLRLRCIRYLDSYFGYCRLFDYYFDVCCCVCPAFDVIHIRVNHFLILLPMWMSLVAESELCVCLSKKCYSFCWKLPFAVARSVSVIFPIIFRNRWCFYVCFMWLSFLLDLCVCCFRWLSLFWSPAPLFWWLALLLFWFRIYIQCGFLLFCRWSSDPSAV